MLGKQLTQAAAGAAADEALYVDDVFSTYVYEGTGASETITNDIDLSGEGGLVWIKRRDGTNSHLLYDTERGVNAYLTSNSTAGQYTASSQQLTSFNSDGFTVGTEAYINNSGSKFTSWAFRKAPGFFDVVTVNHTSTTSAPFPTYSHNLGAVPGCMIVKQTDNTGTWYIYHRSVGPTKYLRFGTNTASSGSLFGNTDPTSTEFSLGNVGTGTFVVYLFAHDDQSFGTNSDESIIKCGSYTGSNSSSNTIDVGFEPQFLLIKSETITGNWLMYDTMRGFTVEADSYLQANRSDAETSSTTLVNPTSNGFHLTSSNSQVNGSYNYVYIAIRRPHKPPTAATEVFHVQTPREATDGTPSELVYTSNFPVDLSINVVTTGSSLNGLTTDRMRGNAYLLTNSTAGESTSIWEFDSNEGVYFNSARSIANDQCGFLFRRAPGFLDIVAYDGTGSTKTESHNLAVSPEMMWVKRRSGAVNWAVYYGDNTDYLILNSNSASIDNHELWNDTSPTASVFTVGPDNDVNAVNNTYIAYLFASLSGISKVGTYTGTGSDINVDCGFTAGARFVLIKRTDSTGDWYVWDTARGIVTGNDPYVLFNSTAAEVTNTDYIDPLNAGFTVTSTAPAGLNASGGSYTFLAIA